MLPLVVASGLLLAIVAPTAIGTNDHTPRPLVDPKVKGDAEGGVAVSLTGKARGPVAVSASKDATAERQCLRTVGIPRLCVPPLIAASAGDGPAEGAAGPVAVGLRESEGTVAVSGTGTAASCASGPACVAVSVMGHATGAVAVSLLGTADGERAELAPCESLNCP